MLRITTSREGIGRCVIDNIDPWCRQTGRDCQILDDSIQLRRGLFINLLSARRRQLAFGPVGFFLPGLAGLESLTKRMEAAAARVNLRAAA
jgi:hypothetical protein